MTVDHSLALFGERVLVLDTSEILKGILDSGGHRTKDYGSEFSGVDLGIFFRKADGENLEEGFFVEIAGKVFCLKAREEFENRGMVRFGLRKAKDPRGV